ncbi:MAG: arabinogalactan endo-1,4-beta-galactosidase [Rickettsiales bacterium]|nr:arabinogalactan endo-1,4-beta-galactosidase [Rickettsiales bacterium]
MTNRQMLYSLIFSFLVLIACEDEPRRGVDPDDKEEEVTVDKFYFGADLSYVNQILDHGGVYKEAADEKSPYEIFADHGTNLARFRLWHNPVWTKEVYENGTQLYNDLYDVEKSIRLAKAEGMDVLLDFHYSDDWADPAKQHVPAAWVNITDIEVLADSIYNYTFSVLSYLDDKGLMPEMVQIGNETNCGMMLSGGNDAFPEMNVCESGWSNMGIVVKAAIKAVKAAAENSTVDTKIAFHVADPVNVEWWFDKLMEQTTDFDFVGISYYPLWHTGVSFNQLEDRIKGFKERFNKEIIILETAYPWTTNGADDYNNLFGGESPISGYPYTLEGQTSFLVELTQKLVDAGASGVVYWEPAWISSQMKDQWGTGSSWENNTFFDFEGNVMTNIDFMTYDYSSNE